MSKNNLLVLIISLTLTFSYSQSNSKKLKYFNEKGETIKKSKFKKNIATNLYFEIPGDSIHHKKLIARKSYGTLTNRRILDSIIEVNTNIKIDSLKPLVILYYPGEDSCNENSNKAIDFQRLKYLSIVKEINRIAETNPIYIFKDKKGLESLKFMNWHKDPKGIIESLFFKYPYPCGSFVVISKNGNFISYLGEYSPEYLFEATREIIK